MSLAGVGCTAAQAHHDGAGMHRDQDIVTVPARAAGQAPPWLMCTCLGHWPFASASVAKLDGRRESAARRPLPVAHPH